MTQNENELIATKMIGAIDRGPTGTRILGRKELTAQSEQIRSTQTRILGLDEMGLANQDKLGPAETRIICREEIKATTCYQSGPTETRILGREEIDAPIQDKLGPTATRILAREGVDTTIGFQQDRITDLRRNTLDLMSKSKTPDPEEYPHTINSKSEPVPFVRIGHGKFCHNTAFSA